MTTRRTPPTIASVSLAAIVGLVAACSAAGPAGFASATPGPSAAPSAPGPTAVPGGPATSAPGSGIVPFAPGEPQPTIVTPGVGLTGIHPVGATKLETSVNGRDLSVRVDWYGGVEPCSVLAGVDVVRDGSNLKLTVREGSAAAPDTACIDIAMYKGTIVDLGELEPGTYTVTAFGEAPPVTVTID